MVGGTHFWYTLFIFGSEIILFYATIWRKNMSLLRYTQYSLCVRFPSSAPEITRRTVGFSGDFLLWYTLWYTLTIFYCAFQKLLTATFSRLSALFFVIFFKKYNFFS